MAIPKKQDGEYTYGDYLRWGEDERYEIIEGKIYLMTAPMREHQLILTDLIGQFRNYLLGKPCQVYPAPFDVVFPSDNKKDIESKNTVQPDISIICNKDILSKNGCFGPPELIIEILSESTSIKDRKEKFHLYEKSGVKEYWIVHPYERWVTVHVLQNGVYKIIDTYISDERVKVNIFPDFEIDLKTVFEY